MHTLNPGDNDLRRPAAGLHGPVGSTGPPMFQNRSERRRPFGRKAQWSAKEGFVPVPGPRGRVSSPGTSYLYSSVPGDAGTVCHGGPETKAEPETPSTRLTPQRAMGNP